MMEIELACHRTPPDNTCDLCLWSASRQRRSCAGAVLSCGSTSRLDVFLFFFSQQIAGTVEASLNAPASSSSSLTQTRTTPPMWLRSTERCEATSTPSHICIIGALMIWWRLVSELTDSRRAAETRACDDMKTKKSMFKRPELGSNKDPKNFCCRSSVRVLRYFECFSSSDNFNS